MSREGDLLGRWPFSRAVYRLATGLPAEWSVRVGVYGPWGSGKTTVLHFLAEQAQADRHPVIWFNPWQYDNQEALLEGFFAALSQVANELIGSKPDLKNWVTDKARSASRVVQKLAPVTNALGSSGKAAHGAAQLVGMALKLDKNDLKKVRASLSERRLIVLVDDVDRAHPSVVPKVFFWIRELFDLPGLSFILAFDLDRVVPVLREHHPGFDGREFLEKIIDFHRWLPGPSAEDILRLSEEERTHHADFVPSAVVQDLLDCLPQSPRAVRGVFRHLRALRFEVQRHREGELDFPLILLVEILRAGWPLLFDRLRREEELLQKLVLAPIFKDRTNRQQDDEAKAEELETIKAELKEEEHREVERLHAVFGQIRSRIAKWTRVPNFDYHAYLLDRPHAVTHGEFDQLVEAWRKEKKHNVVSSWVAKQAKDRDQSEHRVYAELVLAITEMWGRSLEETAEATSNEEQLRKIVLAREANELLVLFVDELQTLKLDRPLPTPAQTIGWIKLIKKWCHFCDDHYVQVLSRAKDLARRLLGAKEISAQSFAPLLLENAAGRPEVNELLNPLKRLVLERLADEVLESLRSPGGIQTLGMKMERWVWADTVTNGGSPLWASPRRKTLLGLLQSADANHEDAVYLWRVLAEDIPAQEHVLLADAKVRTVVWTAAVSRRLNRRIRGTLDEQRNHVAAKEGAGAADSMPLPDWWELPLPGDPVDPASS